jgi:hypothetical protein
MTDDPIALMIGVGLVIVSLIVMLGHRDRGNGR